MDTPAVRLQETPELRPLRRLWERWLLTALWRGDPGRATCGVRACSPYLSQIWKWPVRGSGACRALGPSSGACTLESAQRTSRSARHGRGCHAGSANSTDVRTVVVAVRSGCRHRQQKLSRGSADPRRRAVPAVAFTAGAEGDRAPSPSRPLGQHAACEHLLGDLRRGGAVDRGQGLQVRIAQGQHRAVVVTALLWIAAA